MTCCVKRRAEFAEDRASCDLFRGVTAAVFAGSYVASRPPPNTHCTQINRVKRERRKNSVTGPRTTSIKTTVIVKIAASLASARDFRLPDICTRRRRLWPACRPPSPCPRRPIVRPGQPSRASSSGSRRWRLR